MTYNNCGNELLNVMRRYVQSKGLNEFTVNEAIDEMNSSKSTIHNKSIQLCGYTFMYLQDIIPNNINGKIMEYNPQNDYHNANNYPLNKYGEGMFCRFNIAAENVPGVYIWMMDNEIIYTDMNIMSERGHV